MHITMSDMMPISLCLATHELFDAKRFQQNFGDYCLLRSRGDDMESVIWPLKRELGSSVYEKKYLEGHKAVIVSNIDKILSLVSARYGNLNIKSIEVVIKDGKSLMKKVLQSTSFQDIMFLEPTFKSKIVLPVYELFLEYNKRAARVV
jgi:hypothetical protein